MSRTAKLLIAIIGLYPILLVAQGLDFTDQGYWASTYASIFRHPEDVSYTFNCWLSDIVGGSFLAAFGFLGLASLRLGYVLVLYLTVAFAHRIVRRTMDVSAEAALGASVIAVLFATWDEQGSMVWVDYNNLSALFFVAAVYCLVRWAETSALKYLIASGVILGMNVFVRLPNAAGASLAVVVIFHGVTTKRRPARIVLDVLAMAGAFLAGVAICLAILAALGHLPLFFKGIRDVLGAKQDQETHGFEKMVKIPLKNNIGTVQIGAYALALVAALRFVGARLQRWGRPWVETVLAVLVGLALALRDIPLVSRLARKLIRGGPNWSYVGILYIVLAVAVLGRAPRTRDPVVRMTALAALLIMVVFPMGSERSLMGVHYVLWLPIAAVGAYLYSVPREHEGWLFLKVACSVVVGVVGIKGSWTTPYRDVHDRTELVHVVHDPKLRLIATTSDRARVIQELVDASPAFMKRGDFAIAFDYTPMLNYLTETRPYLFNPNPMYYSAETFDDALETAEAAARPLPVIFHAKGPLNDDWPRDVSLPAVSNLHKFITERAHLRAFEARHDYMRVWENTYFEIWKPRRGDRAPSPEAPAGGRASSAPPSSS